MSSYSWHSQQGNIWKCCFPCTFFPLWYERWKKGLKREDNYTPAAFNSWPWAKPYTAVLQAHCMTTFFHLSFLNTLVLAITLLLHHQYPIIQKFFLLRNKISANCCVLKHLNCKNASNATSRNGKLLPHIATVFLTYFIIIWIYMISEMH